MSIEIITTKDGSHSLRNSELDETYHSIHGAIQESTYVFIEAGLDFLLKSNPGQLRIFEVGFGAGLNAYLTLLHQSTVSVESTAIETNPLGRKIYEQLNYPQKLGEEAKLFLALHEAGWDRKVQIQPWFSLKKIKGKIEEADLAGNQFDLVYFDAFAPGKQPEIWSLSALKRVTSQVRPGGVLVTYCAKGQFKRDLKTLGWEVQTLPGPPGKFEMVRAFRGGPFDGGMSNLT